MLPDGEVGGMTGTEQGSRGEAEKPWRDSFECDGEFSIAGTLQVSLVPRTKKPGAIRARWG